MQAPIRIELPTMYGMKTVNAYLFLDPVPTLIDCGEKSAASWEALEAALAKYDLTIKDIQRVIITHAHVDHIGMAGKIVANSDAVVWVNEYCYPWAVEKEKMWAKRMAMMGKELPKKSDNTPSSFSQMILGFMEKVAANWDNIPEDRLQVFPMNGTLNFGGGEWEVIYVPGHANMQTCFYQATHKWLLSADMLLSITPTAVMDVSIEDPTKRDRGLIQLLDSYKKMEALEVEKVFPGHYEPFGNHRALIEGQVRRIYKRIEQTYTLIAEGHHPFMEILGIMYEKRINMPAMSMLRGYLDVLLEDNRIEHKKKMGYFIKSEEV